MCVCVCVCVARSVGYSSASMNEQLWDLNLRVNVQAEQAINFKHRKWGFPITVKVRAASY